MALLKTIKKEITANLEDKLNKVWGLEAFYNRVIYPKYREIQKDRWDSENQTQGPAWKKLNYSYEKSKLRKYASYPGGGRKMLVATSRLVKAVIGPRSESSEHNKLITGRKMIINITTPYAAMVNAIRPFDRFNNDTMRELQKLIHDYFAKQANK